MTVGRRRWPHSRSPSSSWPGAFIWLSATVDQQLNDRTQAAAVAFQAPAPRKSTSAARQGRLVIIDAGRWCRPPAAAARLLSGSGDSGSVTSVRANGTRVTVTVSVTTGGRASVGTASATAVMGFDRAGG